VVVACVPKVQSAHGPHAAVVECAEQHPYHLRGEAPVLGAVEQYRNDQATVYTAQCLCLSAPNDGLAILYVHVPPEVGARSRRVAPQVLCLLHHRH
jgi:hypothetical protein